MLNVFFSYYFVQWCAPEFNWKRNNPISRPQMNNVSPGSIHLGLVGDSQGFHKHIFFMIKLLNMTLININCTFSLAMYGTLSVQCLLSYQLPLM
jgi:hypothetical protein